jgi:hypothetical protein
MRREYVIAGLIFLLLIGIAAAEWADRNGWIAHRLKLNVTYGDTWKTGEERDCNSELVGGDLTLACGIHAGEMTNSRIWDVTLHGRVTDEEISWLCRHDETAITCKPSN